MYEDFQKSLVSFAKNNPKEIRKNADFRNKFNHLCLELGVDPLVCNILYHLNMNIHYFYLILS